MAFELGWSEWKLAFATAPADAPRLRSVGGRNTQAILQEIANAKKRFGLPEDAPVFCCYEAGRDGFWLHRWLVAQGYHNLVVDSSSIETKRRQRRAKNDRLDASKLVSMLLRYHGGEKKVWSAVQVPSVADEDRRQLHRDLLELKAERTQHVNRIKGLLAGCGLAVTTIDEDFPTVLAELRQWDGTPSSDNQVAPIFLAGSSRENGPSRPSRVLLRRRARCHTSSGTSAGFRRLYEYGKRTGSSASGAGGSTGGTDTGSGGGTGTGRGAVSSGAVPSLAPGTVSDMLLYNRALYKRHHLMVRSLLVLLHRGADSPQLTGLYERREAPFSKRNGLGVHSRSPWGRTLA